MKTTYKILFGLFVVLYGCGYDNFDDDFQQNYVFYARNTDIASIREIYDGKSGNIYEDLIIGGYVIANDRSGNFYRTFIIDDGTGAIEVKAGFYNIHNRFPEGRYVAIKAKGLAVGKYNEVLEIGMIPETGPYQTDYMAGRGVADKYLHPAPRFSEINPIAVSVGELSEELCGRLVRVGPVVFSPGEEYEGIHFAWTSENSYTSNTYREFSDTGGNAVAVVTSLYADFAQEIIPGRFILLTGILSKGKAGAGSETFILKLRSLEDVIEL